MSLFEEETAPEAWEAQLLEKFLVAQNLSNKES